MSFTPRGQHVASMYLHPDRPTVPRQRSNSLPIGLAQLNAEEAGILFSAAERATARRRRIISVDTPAWPVDSPMEDLNWPLPSTSTIKPSPSRNITAEKLEVKEIVHRGLNIDAKSRALRDLDTDQVVNADALFKILPVDPVSPTKRQVTTRSLKSYADGLFQFTQNRLVSSVPQVKQHLASPITNVFEDEPVSSQNDAAHKSRPSLESRFSDWSVTTRDPESSRQSLLLTTPPVFDMDLAMMSPDSFFGGFDEQASRKDFDRLRSTTGYASSETYDAHSEFPFQPPPPPPPSQLKRQEPVEEFSYFTNYDKFINQDTASEGSQPALEPPSSMAIEISPLEQNLSPPTPPPPRRARAETVIRQPVIARSCSSGAPMARFAQSSPATPYQLADVGIRVPNWCVGAIG